MSMGFILWNKGKWGTFKKICNWLVGNVWNVISNEQAIAHQESYVYQYYPLPSSFLSFYINSEPSLGDLPDGKWADHLG